MAGLDPMPPHASVSTYLLPLLTLWCSCRAKRGCLPSLEDVKRPKGDPLFLMNSAVKPRCTIKPCATHFPCDG